MSSHRGGSWGSGWGLVMEREPPREDRDPWAKPHHGGAEKGEGWWADGRS